MAIKRRKKGGVRWVGPAKLVADAQSSASDASSGDYPGGGHYQSAQPQHKPYKVVSAKPVKKDPPKKVPPKAKNGKKKVPTKTQSSTSVQLKKA